MKLKTVVLSMIIMLCTSFFLLCGLSVLTYIFKWQADIAMVGIVLTYILTGVVGGLILKKGAFLVSRKKDVRVEEQAEVITVGKKMKEAIFAGSMFMGILLLLSVIFVPDSFAFSGRLLVIWMLLLGSACLGRIL